MLCAWAGARLFNPPWPPRAKPPTSLQMQNPAAGEVVAAKELDIGQSPVLQEAFITECLRLQSLRWALQLALPCI